MYHKRQFVMVFVAVVLGALGTLVLIRYQDVTSLVIVIAATICGGLIAVYGRLDDALFRDEALETLLSVRNELRRHTNEHSVTPYDEDSARQQMARLSEQLTTLQERIARQESTTRGSNNGSDLVSEVESEQ